MRFRDYDVFGVDIETTPFCENRTPQFVFGTIYSETEQRVFRTVDEFWSFVAGRTKHTVFAFFNLGFDFHFLAEKFPPYRRVKVNHLGKPSFVEIRKLIRGKRVNILFLDIANFVGAQPLEKIAEQFTPDTPKLHSDVTERPADPRREEDVRYCMRDAEICYRVLKMVFERFGMGISLPQIAGRWLKKILNINPKRPGYVKQCERESYFGGFTEIYQFTLEPVEAVKLDVNSMYPHVMCRPLPRRFIREMSGEEVANFEPFYSEKHAFLVFGEFEVEGDFGILPIRVPDSKTIIRPVKRVKGWYWDVLLVFGKKYGFIKSWRIERVLIYEKTSEHVRHIKQKYEERLKAKTEAENLLIKLFLNAGYGKLAQLKRISFSMTREEFMNEFGNEPEGSDLHVEYFENPSKKRGEKVLWFVRPYGEVVVLERRSDEEVDGGFTACSSYITTLAQTEILKHIVKAKDNVLMVDTDCITVQKNAFPIFQSDVGKGLGQFKIEAEGLIEIFAPKIYTVHKKTGEKIEKVKGIPKGKLAKARLVLIEKSRKVWEFFALLKPREAKRRKLPAYSLLKEKKEIFGMNRYVKGCVLKDGRVVPLRTEMNSPLKIFGRKGCVNADFLQKFYKNYFGGFI